MTISIRIQSWPTTRITQSHNGSMTQFLPLSGFHHFADFAFHQVAFQRADVGEVELAVEVIGFVEQGAGQEFFSGFLEELAVSVLGADSYFVGASDVFAEVRDAETSLTLGLLAFGMNNFRIDEDEAGLGNFFESHVDDGYAAPDADLRCGEA